ncbi:SDR family NAD(P)-dependent oxidoreductase [Amycolatopsis methanolica]|uniref:Short-chain dehydrogenase/reductase SDR n=1 Tax=Amycolatopsis methanolica 239 TaxID=1068978 RepID=A0A076MTZ2_AMYME|nr:SDR family NAD(P)-dependent oxidoreductase [Amycolatopsis methanolica]AIJ21267.1 short-chain dehydrogenase/reductase SDR [Amycolatopsis methanolica 239]
MTERRVPIVTGAGSGIGAATARRLSARGVRLVLVDREAGPVRRLAGLLDAVAVLGDVTDPETTSARYGPRPTTTAGFADTPLIAGMRAAFLADGFPLISADDAAAAVEHAWSAAEPGRSGWCSRAENRSPIARPAYPVRAVTATRESR